MCDQFELPLDCEDLKYEDKLILNFSAFEKALGVIDDLMKIDTKYLPITDLQELKDNNTIFPRLVFNILTTPSKVVTSNCNEFCEYQKLASAKLVNWLEMVGATSAETFVDLLMQNRKQAQARKMLGLGYKDRVGVKAHLRQIWNENHKKNNA